jgi:hypothetical protein
MNENFPTPKVIGGSAYEKEEVDKLVQRKQRESLESLYGEDLLESTPEENEVISSAVDYVQAVAEQYGSQRNASVDRVAVVKNGALKKYGGGLYSNLDDTIAVERCESLLLLGRTVAHELFHKMGYKSFQVKESEGSGRKDGIYRTGISMKSRKDSSTYFLQAEEAMAAVMSASFFTDVLSKEEHFQEEIQSSEAIKSWMVTQIKTKKQPEHISNRNISFVESIAVFPHAIELLNVIKTSDKDSEYIFGYIGGFLEQEIEQGVMFTERPAESEEFESTILRLVESDPWLSLTKEELFEMFAKAHFTGNYLPLARKIDSALGVGTFRVVAKELGVNFK